MAGLDNGATQLMSPTPSASRARAMGSATRVAIVATHPIQYQVPWFRALAASGEIDLKVYFALLPDEEQQGVGFGVGFQWDIPLREGYDWEVLENRAGDPGLHSFFGCNAPGIHRALRDWGAEVAILTGWHSLVLLQALWAAKRLRLPVIVRGESNDMRRRPGWKRLGHRILFRSFDRLLTIGRANRALYRSAGVSAARLFDAPYMVDNERFALRAVELADRRAVLRERWQIADGACCFLFAGKLTDKKRPLDLIEAARLAGDRGADLHLLVVGDGVLMEAARQKARALGLPVTFAGFLNQSEMAEAYVASDCLVLPSDDGETWGLVVNEAMACGRPAIVSDKVGCGPDLIRDGETGYVFPLGDVEALAERLTALAADPERLAEMGRRAQRLVRDEYNLDRAVEGTLAAIRSCGPDARGRA